MIIFKKEFEFEKTLSEYKRVKIICYLLAIGMVVSILNNYLDFLDLQKFFKFKTSGYAIIIWVFFFLNYELIFLFLLRRYIKNKISINLTLDGASLNKYRELSIDKALFQEKIGIMDLYYKHSFELDNILNKLYRNWKNLRIFNQ